MLWENFNFAQLLISYLALLVTIIGCELALSYLVQYYASDCIEPNDLVDSDGKITFNPIRYFDLIGTVIFPLTLILGHSPIFFGWSKTLWLNLQKVINRHGLNLALLLTSSGVIFHFFIAFASSLALSYTSFAPLQAFLETLIAFNVFFVVIKLCPILPYDGLKILSLIALKFGSDSLTRFYLMITPYGMFIFIAVVLTPLKTIIITPAMMILNFLL